MILSNLRTAFAATQPRVPEAARKPAPAPDFEARPPRRSADRPEPAPAARFSRILCLVEFSETGYRAIQFADSLALRLGAALTLLHVAPAEQVHLSMARPGADRHLSFCGGRRRALRIAETSRPGEGPAREIVRAARQERHDLIVLPAHPAGSLRRLLPVRTPAGAVLARTRCAVISGVHFSGPVHQGPLVCAVARGPESRSLVTFAAGLARSLGAPLALVHAAGGLPETRLYDEHWNLTPTGRIHDELFEMQQECGAEGEILMEPGPPAEAVARAAARLNASLVITRRPAPAGLLARFRVPEPEILRSCPCPVLHL